MKLRTGKLETWREIKGVPTKKTKLLTDTEEKRTFKNILNILSSQEIASTGSIHYRRNTILKRGGSKSFSPPPPTGKLVSSIF